MKLSIDGQLRLAAQAAFATGLAAASFQVFAQDATAAPAPVVAEAPAAAETAVVADATLPVEALPAAAAPADAPAEKAVQLEKVRITGSRVVIPGAVSSSPIVTVRAEEFSL